MPTFLIDSAQIQDRRITLADAVGHHLARVHRVRVGEPLQLTNGRGTRYRGTVAAVRRATVEVAIDAQETIAAPRLHITLAAAIIAPDRWKLTLEKATELGVARIVPLVTDRTQGRDFRSKRERWSDIIAASATQCDTCWWPDVADVTTFTSILADVAHYDAAYLAWEDARAHQSPRLGVAAPADAQRMLLCIGPTGGWTPDEITAAHDAAMHLVHLGPHVLRAETAAIVALTLVQAHTW